VIASELPAYRERGAYVAPGSREPRRRLVCGPHAQRCIVIERGIARERERP
jgi:hypothetical protein